MAIVYAGGLWYAVLGVRDFGHGLPEGEIGLRLYQLDYLMAVCKCGSISNAADALNVSRPAVSRALKDLEMEFDIELFVRTPTGVILTETGQIFYEKCLKIQRLFTELESDMAALKKTKNRHNDRRLRIGLTPTTAFSIFPKFYPRFIEKYPDMIVVPQEMLATQSAILLRRNELDVSLALYLGDSADELSYFDVGKMELVFCCSKSHWVAGEKRISIEDIRDEPIILLDQSLMKGYLVDSLYSKYGLTPNIKFRTSQLSTILHMVENGICCTIQFEGLVEDNDNITAIPLEDSIKCPIRVSWNQSIPHNSAFYDFMDYTKENMKYIL